MSLMISKNVIDIYARGGLFAGGGGLFAGGGGLFAGGPFAAGLIAGGLFASGLNAATQYYHTQPLILLQFCFACFNQNNYVDALIALLNVS